MNNDNNNNGEPNDLMDQFFTSEKASAGVKLYLDDALGHRTNQWIKIRGADSEEFRLMELAAKRAAVKIASIPDERERDRAAIELSRKSAATLVMEWSFPIPCTQENVIEFFRKAPQVQDAVDRNAGSRRLFHMVVLDNSTPTSTQSEGST